jgi:hypothetical protein
MIGIGIGLGRRRFADGGVPPSPSFANTQWQLITQQWQTIITTWN